MIDVCPLSALWSAPPAVSGWSARRPGVLPVTRWVRAGWLSVISRVRALVGTRRGRALIAVVWCTRRRWRLDAGCWPARQRCARKGKFMSYTRATEHADRAAELAASARHHAADDDHVTRALADAVQEIAKAIAELARTTAVTPTGD